LNGPCGRKKFCLAFSACIGCPVSNETSHLALARIRPPLSTKITRFLTFELENPAARNQHSDGERPILTSDNRKMPMDLKQKQRAVTEFLSLGRHSPHEWRPPAETEMARTRAIQPWFFDG
jgi:hypothetical protein